MRRVLLRVRRDDNCPVFRLGDQMVLELPGVDLASSSKICPFALARFVEKLDPSACDQARSLIERGTFECPRIPLPVLFDVEAIPDTTDVPPGTPVEDVHQTVDHLRSIPIFRPMADAFLLRVAGRVRVERHEDGQVVLHRGHPGRAFFIIKEGAVDVVGFADTDISSVVTHLQAGDCLARCRF